MVYIKIMGNAQPYIDHISQPSPPLQYNIKPNDEEQPELQPNVVAHKWNKYDPDRIINIDMSHLTGTDIKLECVKKAGVDVLNVIGSGAYGSVYHVCRYGDCKYALKVIKQIDGVYEREEFLYEVMVSKKAGEVMSGPKVYEYFKCELPPTIYYMVMMDKFEMTLTSHLREGGDLSLGNAYRLLDVITVLNDSGIIHNDMKPDNIGVSKDPYTNTLNKFYIIDYGLSIYTNDPSPYVRFGWSFIEPKLEWVSWWDCLCLWYIVRDRYKNIESVLRNKLPFLEEVDHMIILPDKRMFPGAAPAS